MISLVIAVLSGRRVLGGSFCSGSSWENPAVKEVKRKIKNRFKENLYNILW
jgi:hypothetical protein